MLQPDTLQPMIVIGTIGGDTHVVGVKILGDVLARAGYRVTNLGAMVPAEEFIKAAIETDARIIMVSSLSGNADFYCRDLRSMCEEAGIGDVLLYVGGNISIGHLPWPEVERRFVELRFDRAFPPQTKADIVLKALSYDLGSKAPQPAG